MSDFSNYPEGSAGSVMTFDFISVECCMSVGDALEQIRKKARGGEKLYTLYITDKKCRLVGTAELQSLVFAEPKTAVRDIMKFSPICVKASDDKEVAAELISEYDLLSLAVVDAEKHLLGIITAADALDLVSDAASEDISIMAAVTPSEKPYINASVFSIFRARIPWLLLLMLSATFTGMIITKFESALAALVSLTAFIPMLMGTGGNSGAQASVTVTRALELGELRVRDIFAVIRKELGISLLCGAALGAACFIKICLFDMMILGSEGVTASVALAVSLTLFLTVISAKLVGAILPISAKKLGLDPAIVASPAITTVVDIISLLLYFGIAKALLGI